MSYYVVYRCSNEVAGPFLNYEVAENQAVLGGGVVVKECSKPNQLGAPVVYPYNLIEGDYPDGEEG